MADNINLLPQQNEESTQQVRQQKMVNQVSAVALIIAIVAVVGLFAGKFALDQQINSVNANIDGLTQRIQAKNAEEGIQQSLTSRIDNLQAFISNQNKYSDYLAALSKTVPTSLKLTDMLVTEEQEATLTGTVANYADLAGFYTKLHRSGAPSGSDEGTHFVNPMLTSISRPTGSDPIEFTLTFTISPTLLKQQSTTGETVNEQ